MLNQNMPCKHNPMTGVFCPGYPIRSPRLTHNLRPVLAQGHGSSLHMNQWARWDLTRGWQALVRVSSHHTHLPTFWGQSSVEGHCCQRLLLHAHNTQITSPSPITRDATAAFSCFLTFLIKITRKTVLLRHQSQTEGLLWYDPVQ